LPRFRPAPVIGFLGVGQELLGGRWDIQVSEKIRKRGEPMWLRGELYFSQVEVWSPGWRRPVAIKFRSAFPHSKRSVRLTRVLASGNYGCRSCVPTRWPGRNLRARHAHHRTLSRPAARIAPSAFWMFDPETRTFWSSGFGDHRLMTREAIWYEIGAVKRYTRGGERRSRRYRTMHLAGPWTAAELRLRTVVCSAHRTVWFDWPDAGCAASPTSPLRVTDAMRPFKRFRAGGGRFYWSRR